MTRTADGPALRGGRSHRRRTGFAYRPQSIWRGIALPSDARPALDAWLQKLSGVPVPDTTSAARPVAAGDRCIVAAGASISPSAVSLPRGLAFSLVPGAPGAPLQLVVSLPERQSASEGVCNAIFHAHTSPRQVAGGALSEDAIKCTLKPVDPRDYGALLSDAQLAQLRAIFPSGVCNYAKPAVGDVAHSVLWPSIGAERLQPLHALLWTVGRSSPSHR